jgi:hypothetical protein
MQTDKIIVTHFADKDFYHFNLPYGEWVINGKEYTNQNYKSEQITSKEEPVIFKVERKTNIVRYKNTTDENMIGLSVGAYEDSLERLKAKGSWCNLDEELVFISLEDEFAYKKFLRDWKPVTEQQILKHRVETEFRHAMIEHDSPFIKSLFCIDQTKPELVQVEFARFQKYIVGAWLKEHNVTDFDFPNHSHLEYFKMGKTYVFTNSGTRNEYNGQNPVRIMSYREADELLESEKKKIEGILYSVLCSLRAIPDVNVRQVTTEIEAVRAYLLQHAGDRVSKSQVVQTCRNDLQKIVTRLENLSKEVISGV